MSMARKIKNLQGPMLVLGGSGFIGANLMREESDGMLVTCGFILHDMLKTCYDRDTLLPRAGGEADGIATSFRQFWSAACCKGS